MNINEKLATLNILRNAGAIPVEIGRKAAALEILGYGDLAAQLVHVADRVEFEEAEVARHSEGQPLFFQAPEGHQFPADLIKAEKLLAEKKAALRDMTAKIVEIAASIETEINAEDNWALTRYQEAKVMA